MNNFDGAHLRGGKPIHFSSAWFLERLLGGLKDTDRVPHGHIPSRRSPANFSGIAPLDAMTSLLPTGALDPGPGGVQQVGVHHGRVQHLHLSEAVGGAGDSGMISSQSCCAADVSQMRPRAARRRDGSIGLLYTSANFHPTFYEYTCPIEPSVGPLVGARVRCVQEYSLIYALFNNNGNIALDYMQIRNGCHCEFQKDEYEV